MQDLSTSDLWWHGPQWLRDPSPNWPGPDESAQYDTEMERKSIRVHYSYFSKFEDILEHFSSFPKAIRVVAYVNRFFYRTHPNYRSGFQNDTKIISSSEIRQTQNRLQTMTQKAYYPNEFMALSAKKIDSYFRQHTKFESFSRFRWNNAYKW